MAIKDARTSNHSSTVKALVGEKIIGVIQDYEGRWWLVVESGHAFVFGGSFWTERPDEVKRLIEKRRGDLGQWEKETKELMDVDNVVLKGN